MSNLPAQSREADDCQVQCEPNAPAAGKKLWHAPTLEHIDYASTEGATTNPGLTDLAICS